MAFPTILIDSASGSDTAASGAGPATALTGTGASLTNTSLDIDLSADSPDLSGVAVDGSAVLWVATSTGRQFYAIASLDNTTKIVTAVAGQTAGATEGSRSWAIGGKRASINAASSRTLFALTGMAANWSLEFASGHAETITSSIAVAAIVLTAADTCSLHAVAGAATPPTLTKNGNFTIFDFGYSGTGTWRLQGLRFRSTTSNGMVGFSQSGRRLLIEQCVIDTAGGGTFAIGFSLQANAHQVVGCDLTAAIGVSSTYGGCEIERCRFLACTTVGAKLAIGSVEDSLFVTCAIGIEFLGYTAVTHVPVNFAADRCTFSGGATGVKFTAHASALQSCMMSSLVFSGQTTEAITIGNTGDTAAAMILRGSYIANCVIYGATSNITAGYESLLTGLVTTDPAFANAAGGDYTPTAAAVIGAGYPQYIGSVRSYPTPGAFQPEAGGSAAIRPGGIILGGIQ